MIKWLKERTKQEKWMLVLIVVLVIGIVARWGFIKKEVGDAFRQRIEHFKAPDGPEPAADSVAGWDTDIARDSLSL